MNSNGTLGELERRLFVLDRIYNLYQEFIAPYDLVCQHGCAACCTCNMTLTTLEGYQLIAGMDGAALKVLFEKARNMAGSKRFQPQMTINKIAQLCKEGKPVPDEIIDPSWGACPLLTDNSCPIYLLRPFGCRCMVSSLDCRETGEAQVDELILTVNNLFLQYIEHIDPCGGTGSLIDILLYFDQPALLETFQKKMAVAENAGLALNRPIPVLMVPPKHRQHVQGLVKRVQEVFIPSSNS